MPTGIILASSSIGAKQEDIEKVFKDNGLEPDKPETPVVKEVVAPQRGDFESDEDFEKAEEEFAAKQEEAEVQREGEEEERQQKQEERHPKLSRRQRAVDKATKELKDQIATLSRELAEVKGKQPAAPALVEKAPEAPKREAFKTDAEYEDALFDHRYKLRRAKEAVEESQNAYQNYLKENLTTYHAKKDEVKEEYDDWDEVLKEFGNAPVSDAIYTTILGLEEGPRVSYYLAKHPDQLEKLNALFPDAAMREVTRLHDRLKTGSSAGERSEKPKITPKRLPEPVKPVSTSATTSTLTSRDAAQARDFRAFKAAQRRGV